MITIGFSGSITHDIIVEGQVAFKTGETVTVSGISPDPQRPEYKYVVASSSLQRDFLLSDADIAPSAPVYAQPPQPPQRPASPAAVPQGTMVYKPPNESLAVLSLVLGIASFLCFGIILGVAAVLLGKNAEKKIAESGGQLGGEGLARAGIICGWIGIALWCIALVIAILVPVFQSI